MFTKTLFIITAIAYLFVAPSCNSPSDSEAPAVESFSSNAEKLSKAGTGQVAADSSQFLRGGGVIGPVPERLDPCYRRSGPFWELDHYKPHTNGKKLGIWPSGPGTPNWTRLRTKWGFTGIVVDPSTYQNAINAGFTPVNLSIEIVTAQIG